MTRVLGIAALAAFVPLAVIAFGANGQPRSVIEGRARVIDGDTIAIGSTHFRLNGVAAPERNEPGGRAATNWMRRHLAGRTVRCKLNGERSYNRLVAICYVNGRDIGAAIIRAGFARDCPRYSSGRYQADELAARRSGRNVARIYPLPGYCRR